LFRPAGDGAGDIIGLAPLLAGMTAVDGKATAYICESFRCSAPVTGAEELGNRLIEMEKKDD
jgi:uncharacterized protein YyaL (SSP411 family)